MSPLEWQELSDFFDQISDLPPEERSRRLQEAVSIRPDWQPYLEQMIQEYESASDFLRTPAAQVSELWPPARSVFQEGELLEGRFQVIRCIGRGGMGEVYEAEDPVFGKVALKTLLPWLADKPDFVEQFKREATRSRRISHNNVCRVHDLHKLVRPAGDEVWYYSMELLCGETLACHLEAGVLAPVDQSTNFLHQIIDALEAAHSRGVLHRDLKPANIFLERREPYPRVVVTDFGIAGDFSLTETLAQLTEGSDSAMGTLWYMSPEQLEQLPLTPASDLYSLGLIAYEMLCGQRPFSRMSPIAAAIRRTRERPPSLKELVPAIPEQLDRAVMRSLEPKAKDR
ncbi:MAG TPA: serine/threonine-protein kinase, partial [Bryobacteraceae bacterium]|nr:serine/threonine-protein kinase [Bryobacteraceae bacterium]